VRIWLGWITWDEDAWGTTPKTQDDQLIADFETGLPEYTRREIGGPNHCACQVTENC
jgi:hypothetical protein